MKKRNEITINWHILEQCNYKCKHCFAKYDKCDTREIHKSEESILILLNKVYKFFTSLYNEHDLRINIAGGEPMLSKNISFIIEQAYLIGFKVSIITNASKLTDRFIEINAKYISMFAISVDSIVEETNINIGRASKKDILKEHQIIKYIELLRCINKDIKIKINTVVNEFNYDEYLGNFIDLINPFKWKVFQALSFTNKVYCNDEHFSIFLNKHKDMKSKIYKESNDDMTNSYIMIDPYGRFYQNTHGSYTYSTSIVNTEISQAFNSVEFDIRKFKNRYISHR